MASIPEFPRLAKGVQSTAALVLLLAAAAALLVPNAVQKVTGVRPAPVLSSPDELPPLSKEDEAPFFQSRNQIEIRVDEATTLRAFLDRNRLNKPFHRKQIVDQLGSASPDAPIAAGTRFRLRLTPVVDDVPGAAPDDAEGTD
ncbi:MAG TPA: hypothetical protein VFO89_06480 [Thermoanaerobaculia bacterium]|nr:hypothetical protein [Thermoanaerobaculia bacterium]